jgi:hypothetical protein
MYVFHPAPTIKYFLSIGGELVESGVRSDSMEQTGRQAGGYYAEHYGANYCAFLG